jgi:hypothetical protein
VNIRKRIMPIRVKCESCKKTLSVKDHLAGKKIKCPVCQNVVIVPAAPPPKTPTTTPASKPAPPGTSTKRVAAAKPASAHTPTPDKTKSNGAPTQAGAAKSNGTPAPAPEIIELPPENIEAEAASALTDEPPAPAAKDAGPKTIDFKCTWCDEDLHFPIELAGKQAPCTNPECRRIVKVPLAKVEEKKDWRKMDRRGPAAAVVNQPEQLENAWGTEEATRARQDSLAQAGAIDQPPTKPVGGVGWLIRAFYTLAALVLLVLGTVGGYQLYTSNQQHNALREAKKLVTDKEAKIKTPLLSAEGHRTLALLYLREGKAIKAKELFQGSLSLVEFEASDKNPAINEQLFLIELALSKIELGGEGDEVLSKAKLEWKDVRDELEKTLQKIQTPDVQVMALRAIGTRLFEKKQAELAIGLAAILSNTEVQGKPPAARGQQIAMLCAIPDQEEQANKIVKKPDPATMRELHDSLARTGYAEGLAWKDDYANALAIAQIPGPPRDRLEALLGVASVAWLRKNKDEATKFVKAALSLANERESNSSDWQKLQLVKLAACTEGTDSIRDIVKPGPFRLRADLETFLALCDKSTGQISADAFQEMEAIDKEGITLALAWTALAKHNARKGASRDRNRRIFEDHVSGGNLPDETLEMIRPMVDIGSYLGSIK